MASAALVVGREGGLGLLFTLLLVELALLLGGGVLVLLVLRHQVVHVGLGLSELHLVHALTGVPAQVTVVCVSVIIIIIFVTFIIITISSLSSLLSSSSSSSPVLL